MPYVKRDDGAVSGVFSRAIPGHATEWLEPDNAEVVAFEQAPLAPPSVISYEAFEARFTDAEAEALLAYTDSIPSLRRAGNRATARNSVDLLSANTIAFMDALVAGSVITSARKDAILAP